MLLLQLPTEILRLIIQASLPDEFEGLALCCKQLFALAKSFIPKHNRYKKRYSKITVGPSAGSSRIHPLSLLSDIRNDPLVPKYIKWAFLDNDEWNLYDRERTNVCSTMCRSLDVFQDDSLMERVYPYLLEADQEPQKWRREIEAGNLPRAFLFLLFHLSEVASLHFLFDWPSSDEYRYLRNHLRSIKCAITEIAVEEVPYGTNPAICRSDTFLRVQWSPKLHSASLRDLAPILALPTLKKFVGSCYQIENWPHYSRLNWKSLPSSQVEHVEMALCSIQKHEMSKFLASLPALRILNWNHSRTGSRGVCWDVGAVANAICNSPAAGQLETLSLSYTEWLSDKNRTAIHPDSIRGLRSLKHLEFHVRLFLGVRFIGSQQGVATQGKRRSANQSSRPTHYNGRFVLTTPGLLHRDTTLTTILPPNIETLRILTLDPGPQHRADMYTVNSAHFLQLAGSLFRNMSRTKAASFPRLRCITIARGKPQPLTQNSRDKVMAVEPLPEVIVRETTKANVELIDDRVRGCADFMVDFQNPYFPVLNSQ